MDDCGVVELPYLQTFAFTIWVEQDENKTFTPEVMADTCIIEARILAVELLNLKYDI